MPIKMIWRVLMGIVGFFLPFGIFAILSLIPGGQLLIILGILLGIAFGLIGFFLENVKRALKIGKTVTPL